MRKKFVSRYQKLAKISVSSLNEIYQDLTGDWTESRTFQERKHRERIVEFLSSNDDEDLIYDLRQLNGNKNSTIFNEFRDEIDNLFTEYQTAAHERRHQTCCSFQN